MNNNQLPIVLLGACLAAGLGSSGYFISQTIYKGKTAINTAETKGLAMRNVKADTVNWEIGYRVENSDASKLPQLYNKAKKHSDVIVNLLTEKGFKENEIEIGVVSYQKHEYRDDKQQIVDESHALMGKISINSHQVDKVAKVRSDINSLIAQGIKIDNFDPVYRYTQLNQIKPAMLKEATKNAKVAANEFAQVAGVQVGGIRNARQGNFTVRDIGNSYYDTQTIEKEVRVVTTITFYLEE